MRKFFEELNKEKLIDFLVAYAENDAEFANTVNVLFRKPEFKKFFVFWKQGIKM